MVVIIDCYKRVVKKETGEVKTIVQCSTAENSTKKDIYGREHLSDVWLDGVYDFVCGKEYETIEESTLFGGRLRLSIVGFKELRNDYQ